jgi:hypothetical protein
MTNHIGLTQLVGDVAAGTAVLGSLAGYLPEVAAGMAIMYYLLQFYRWLRDVSHHHHDAGPDDHSSGPAP